MSRNCFDSDSMILPLILVSLSVFFTTILLSFFWFQYYKSLQSTHSTKQSKSHKHIAIPNHITTTTKTKKSSSSKSKNNKPSQNSNITNTNTNTSSSYSIAGIESTNVDALRIKLVAGVAITLYWIGNILFLLSIIIDTIEDCNVYNGLGSPAFTISTIGFIFELLVFGLRIIKIFEDTKYAISKIYIKYIFNYLIPILFIYQLLNNIFRGTNIFSQTTTLILSVLWGIFLIMFGFLLLKLFVNKLNCVINDFIKEFVSISDNRLNVLNNRRQSLHIEKNVDLNFDKDDKFLYDHESWNNKNNNKNNNNKQKNNKSSYKKNKKNNKNKNKNINDDNNHSANNNKTSSTQSETIQVTKIGQKNTQNIVKTKIKGKMEKKKKNNTTHTAATTETIETIETTATESGTIGGDIIVPDRRIVMTSIAANELELGIVDDDKEDIVDENNDIENIEELMTLEEWREEEIMINMNNLEILMDVMSKYTILISVSLFCTLFLIIILIIIYCISTELNIKEMQKSKYNMVPLSINILINCYCLLLQFDYGYIGFITLCSRCDIFCLQWFINKTNSKHNERKLHRMESGLYTIKTTDDDDDNVGSSNKSGKRKKRENDSYINDDDTVETTALTSMSTFTSTTQMSIDGQQQGGISIIARKSIQILQA